MFAKVIALHGSLSGTLLISQTKARGWITDANIFNFGGSWLFSSASPLIHHHHIQTWLWLMWWSYSLLMSSFLLYSLLLSFVVVVFFCPTNWPTDRLTDRLTHKPTDRPTHRSANRPTDQWSVTVLYRAVRAANNTICIILNILQLRLHRWNPILWILFWTFAAERFWMRFHRSTGADIFSNTTHKYNTQIQIQIRFWMKFHWSAAGNDKFQIQIHVALQVKFTVVFCDYQRVSERKSTGYWFPTFCRGFLKLSTNFLTQVLPGLQDQVKDY